MRCAWPPAPSHWRHSGGQYLHGPQQVAYDFAALRDPFQPPSRQLVRPAGRPAAGPDRLCRRVQINLQVIARLAVVTIGPGYQTEVQHRGIDRTECQVMHRDNSWQAGHAVDERRQVVKSPGKALLAGAVVCLLWAVGNTFYLSGAREQLRQLESQEVALEPQVGTARANWSSN